MREPNARSSRNVEQGAPYVMAPLIAGTSELLRMDVVDGAGELVGELWDIVLNLRAGAIVFGIVALERMQRSERVIAVPWSALSIDTGHGCLSVDAARDWVELAPAIEPNALSRLLEPEFVESIRRHFDIPPSLDRASATFGERGGARVGAPPRRAMSI
jgi:hypothetical protein